ncbi:Ferric-chelate reductase (NADH) [Bertholletia excelsa]
MESTVTKPSSSSCSSSSHGGVNSVREMAAAATITVFLGTLFIWIMTPTNTYRQKWLPKIRADTNSTFFGSQGATILIYTFPMLFIALLGCVYLHLGKKYNSSRMESVRKVRMARLKRPMIVKGLGIVSLTELVFFTMFIALLVWSFGTYLRIGFAKITPESVAEQHEKIWEAKLEISALRLGSVGNICLAFLFFPVTRGSSVLPLFGLTSEASVKYHIWLGHILMTLFTAHGAFYVIYWVATNQPSEMLKWAKTDISNVAGELSLLPGLVMWVTTFPSIRKKMFELFFYTHYLYTLFVFFFILHVGISYSCIMLPGFFLFLVDRFLRFLQSRRAVRLVSVRVLPCETVELNFSKTQGLSYTPTSLVFLNIPSISKLQWHPFTVSSSSSMEPERLSVIIKGEGSWSKKLYQTLSSSTDHLEVAIEGPYGPASTDFLRHDKLVLVSGGSGITPFISIIRELIFMSQTLKSQTPKVLLISAFKSSSDLTFLDLLLPISTSLSDISSINLQIEAYVTREKESKSQKPLQALWLKPKATEAALSPILGPNSWLWLGTIIASSFTLFLLLLGILTRFYIYPIDHNTDDVYSYSARAILNMLLICFSIAFTSTVAFYWNKKQLGREANQIETLEGPTTPAASPGTGFCHGEIELESLPLQSLAESIHVHYGERPDLKRILFELKEESIGVLVCGPRKLRHEVASICSSGLVDNLHFESISFNW